MQTQDRAGIICDNCGIVNKSEFTYYSLDFKKVEVYGNNKPSLQQILTLESSDSKDICTACYDNIKKKIVEIYTSQMSNKFKAPARYIVCELTGKKLDGTYNYYYCVVSHVKVNIIGQPSYCIKCKTSTFDKNQPCSSCGNRQFITPAKVTTDDRHLEFSVSEESYVGFQSKAIEIKNKQSNWTTRSE